MSARKTPADDPAALAPEVLERQRELVEALRGPRVSSWVSLVGHDLMSDELAVGASQLARDLGVGLTLHLSPTTSDPESYLARTGPRPVCHLADLGLFEGATQIGLERLAQHVTAHRLEPGSVLIREGDDPDDVFVIRCGDFDVSADGVTVNRMGAGDWAGEIGLVEELPRTATVRAESPATVWRIPGGLFLAVLAGDDVPSGLDDHIARRLAMGRSSRSHR